MNIFVSGLCPKANRPALKSKFVKPPASNSVGGSMVSSLASGVSFDNWSIAIDSSASCSFSNQIVAVLLELSTFIRKVLMPGSPNVSGKNFVTCVNSLLGPTIGTPKNVPWLNALEHLV